MRRGPLEVYWLVLVSGGDYYHVVPTRMKAASYYRVVPARMKAVEVVGQSSQTGMD